MSRYTVLGARGFVGSRLVQFLDRAGHTCFAPERNDPAILTEDLGSVFYCIGLTADFSQRKFDTVTAHVSYFSEILQKARFDRIVYLSSTRLYDESLLLDAKEAQALTFSPSNPRHLYDLSKALGENLCLTASDGRGSVARLSCVYEAAADAPGFLSELFQQARLGESFTVDSSSGITRDYIHVDDVVRALKAIVDSGLNDIVNVASGENVSNQQIIDEFNSLGYALELKATSERKVCAECNVERLIELGVVPIKVSEFIKNTFGSSQ